jgi:hypothetical protein
MGFGGNLEGFSLTPPFNFWRVVWQSMVQRPSHLWSDYLIKRIIQRKPATLD